jgi:hypothetical protein
MDSFSSFGDIVTNAALNAAVSYAGSSIGSSVGDAFAGAGGKTGMVGVDDGAGGTTWWRTDAQGHPVEVVPDFKPSGGYASGGIISGPGTGTSDSIPAVAMYPGGAEPIRVSNGEAILSKKAVDILGEGFINRVNSGQISKYAEGGVIARVRGDRSRARLSPALKNSSGGGAPVRNETTIVNAIDSPSFLDSALNSPVGGQKMINWIKANQARIRTLVR